MGVAVRMACLDALTQDLRGHNLAAAEVGPEVGSGAGARS